MNILLKEEREEIAFVKEEGRKRLEGRFQKIADAIKCIGSDGLPLRRTRRISMTVRSTLGDVKLGVITGKRRSDGKYETPFRVKYFRGEHEAVSPALEQRLVTAVCETGSFESASKLCAKFGITISDDKLMDTIRRVGEACQTGILPTKCDNAAGRNDTLIIMMDGWMSRYRESKWGDKKANIEDRVAWHEVKSAVLFKLADVAEVNKGRRTIVTKHIVSMPAGTSPVDFGRKVQDEAMRMGLACAKKVYVIMDGGTYLWNIYDDRFADIAEPLIDYYHVSQHLGVLADALFANTDDENEKESWLKRYRSNLKKWGPKTLMDGLIEAENKIINNDADCKTIQREVAYFRKHKEHMDYRKARKNSIPCGSGAVESLCSQLQNRFKRRGQFWSKQGLDLFMRAYVWYTNEELDYIYQAAA